MKKITRTKIDKRLQEVFLILTESDYIQNGKLTSDGSHLINLVTNELLNEFTNAEARDLESEASFYYDDKSNDVFAQETIIDYVSYKLVDFIQGVSRSDEKIFRGVVDSDSEFMTYTYKQTEIYYDELEPSTPDNPSQFVISQAQLYELSKQQDNEFEKFETEFDKHKTNVDYHKIVKLLFTDKFYDCNKEVQDYLLSVFIKQANNSRLTTNQETILAQFLHNKRPYSDLLPNEKKQISRITHHKMNLK